jgi:hypothetical protein
MTSREPIVQRANPLRMKVLLVSAMTSLTIILVASPIDAHVQWPLRLGEARVDNEVYWRDEQ